MVSPIVPFPMPGDWCVYGLDAGWTGGVFLQGYGRGGAHATGWRPDYFHLHYGPRHDHDAPNVHIVSSPLLGEAALRLLHSGLGEAGFEYGMSGTGHVSGAPARPEAVALPFDGAVVEAEVWRGGRTEVAWIETVDTWVAVAASRVPLAEVGLMRIRDVGPLLEARKGTMSR